MILVDSNIPMYLVGSPHPHKSDAQRCLEQLVNERQRLVTDAEVLQEILHRYVAIDRRDAIQPAFDAPLGVVDQVLDVTRAAAERAKEMVLGHRRLSARDAIHLAVMERHGIDRILSGIPSAAVLTTRGGDFELHVDQDASIGYLNRADTTVRS